MKLDLDFLLVRVFAQGCVDGKRAFFKNDPLISFYPVFILIINKIKTFLTK